MTRRRSILKSASALAALSLMLPGLARADEPLPVVATFSVLGDMVQRIGGAHIALTTLVGPDGDAHVYQPTPQAAAAVAGAEVLFVNGLEFEGWLERLARAAPFKGEMIVATTGIDAIAYDDEQAHDDHDDHDDHTDGEKHDDHDDHADGEKHDDHDDHAEGEKHDDHDDHADGDKHDDHDDHAEGEKHDDHDDHADHDHGTFDPHAWQTVENAVIYVDNITAGLAKADPANAGDYYANRAAYVAELQALEDEIDAMMSSIPPNNRTVVSSHDAFGYFGKHYGLTFKAPQGLSTESEASAADVAALITQIRDQGITAVFVETVADNRLIKQIANETSATIGGELYAGALSEADGPAPTYIDMLRHNAKALSQALGN